MSSFSRQSADVGHDAVTRNWPVGLASLAESKLPEFLQRQRWYPAKDSGRPSVALSVLLPLAVSGVPAVVAIWQVTPPGQPPLHLFVPLALVPSEKADPAQMIAELPAETGHSSGEMWLVEAFSVDAFVRAWIDVLLRGGGEASGSVGLRALPTTKNLRRGGAVCCARVRARVRRQV